MDTIRRAGSFRRSLYVLVVALAWASAAAVSFAPSGAMAAGPHRQHSVTVQRAKVRTRHRALPASAHASPRHHSR